MNVQTRRCSRCAATKPVDDFPRDASQSSGRRSNCRDCDAKRKAVYNAAHAEDRRAYSRRYRAENAVEVHDRRAVKRTPAESRRLRYGLTQERFLQMLDEQDDRCAICRGDMPWPNVDHDHDTRKVRGLLCSACNRGLGQFGDDADVVQAAADYLRAHA